MPGRKHPRCQRYASSTLDPSLSSLEKEKQPNDIPGEPDRTAHNEPPTDGAANLQRFALFEVHDGIEVAVPLLSFASVGIWLASFLDKPSVLCLILPISFVGNVAAGYCMAKLARQHQYSRRGNRSCSCDSCLYQMASFFFLYSLIMTLFACFIAIFIPITKLFPGDFPFGLILLVFSMISFVAYLILGLEMGIATRFQCNA